MFASTTPSSSFENLGDLVNSSKGGGQPELKTSQLTQSEVDELIEEIQAELSKKNQINKS